MFTYRILRLFSFGGFPSGERMILDYFVAAADAAAAGL